MSSERYSPKLDLTYIDQVSCLKGIHRSGWQYAVNALAGLQVEEGIWCDTYVDRTFHWLRQEKLLPYTRPWIGFIHHTFDTVFSIYNNVNLLANPHFIASLDTCKGLFVFSSKEKERWMVEFEALGLDIPIETISHPTEDTSVKFTWQKFIDNPTRRIIQVGAWLRDSYAVYRLNDGEGEMKLRGEEEEVITVRKSALIGPNMQLYFKPRDFFRQLEGLSSVRKKKITHAAFAGCTRFTSVTGNLPVSQCPPVESPEGMCRDNVCRDVGYGPNRYVAGAFSMLRKYDESVTLLPTASNEEYDELLSENIVFLKLYDASAVNTLIECVMRNTPVVVNKLPAVVEVLGDKYPLYFSSENEVSDLLTISAVENAYHYMEQMDKSSLSIEYFLTSLTSSPIYKSLVVEEEDS